MRSTRPLRTKERRRSRLTERRRLWLWRGLLLAAAAGLMVLGLAEGEALVVLQKAVKICLECIGIG